MKNKPFIKPKEKQLVLEISKHACGMNVQQVAQEIKVSWNTAKKYIDRFVDLGVLHVCDWCKKDNRMKYYEITENFREAKETLNSE